MLRSKDDNPLLAEIRAEKAKLIELFDEAYITTDEYQDRLEGLFQRERGIYNEIDRQVLEKYRVSRSQYVPLLACLTIGLLVGFFASPHLYNKIFGYRNAEECALDNSTKIGMAMCFRVYQKKDDEE